MVEEKLYIGRGQNRRPAIKTNCAFCGDEFLKNRSKFKGHGEHFCSRRCVSLSQRDRVELTCDICGKKFFRAPAKIKRNIRGYNFCSHVCSDLARKEENGALISTLDSGKHVNYRKKALKFHGEQCVLCGYNEHVGVLEVHHIDKNTQNNSLDNLVVLCANCHKMTHIKDR